LSGKREEIAAQKAHDAQHMKAALEVIRENVSVVADWPHMPQFNSAVAHEHFNKTA
jgi:hypothetical protein